MAVSNALRTASFPMRVLTSAVVHDTCERLARGFDARLCIDCEAEL